MNREEIKIDKHLTALVDFCLWGTKKMFFRFYRRELNSHGSQDNSKINMFFNHLAGDARGFYLGTWVQIPMAFSIKIRC